MKNIGILLAIALVCAFERVALCATFENTTGVVNSTINVTDYNSFLNYAAQSEQLAVKNGKPVTPRVKTGETIRLKKENIELSERIPINQTADFKKDAYLAPSGKVALVDKTTTTYKVSILDRDGGLIKEGKLPKFRGSVLAFSDTRLFLIGTILGSNGGFEVFDYDGKLIRENDPGFVSGYVISNTQKYFAVTAGRPDEQYYFVLYDMDGNEKWRQGVMHGGHVQLEFSRDDKFIVIKMPVYWIKNKGDKESATKKKKLYVINLENKKIVSEETYEK